MEGRPILRIEDISIGMILDLPRSTLTPPNRGVEVEMGGNNLTLELRPNGGIWING